MALMKKKFSEIPTDAVILSEEDALAYQIKLVKDWKNKSDVWALNYGHQILMSLSAISSIYVSNHYRTKLRLLNYGRLSSYLPVVVLPALACGIFHQQFIVTDILLQKSCPVCIQVRSATYQVFLSTIFPTILAPLAALPFAIRYNTYNIPSFTKEPLQVFKLLYRHTKPLKNILLGMIAFQALVAGTITFQETKSVLHMHETLNKLEKSLEEQFENTGQ